MYTSIDYRKIRYLFYTFSCEEYHFASNFIYADIGNFPDDESDEILGLADELSEKFPDLFNNDTDLIFAFVEVAVDDLNTFGIYAMEDRTILMTNRDLKEARSFTGYKEPLIYFRNILDKYN